MNTIYFKSALAAMLFLCCKMYGQDTLRQSIQLMNYKIQLLETQIKLMEAKQQLSETNPVKPDPKMEKKMDSLLNSVKTSTKKSDTTSFEPFKSAFKLNPTRLFEGTFHLSYERAIRKNFSIDISAMGTYISAGGMGSGYLESQSLLSFDGATDTYFSYQGKVITGWGTILQTRNYLLPKIGSDINAPLGLYASPQFMYRKTWITGYTTSWIDSAWQEKTVKQNLDIFAIGVILGGKFTIHKVVCVDIFIGGAWRFSKYTNEDNLTRNKGWRNIDYSGVLPSAGISIGIMK